jgi:DNA repair photolyase
MNAGGGLGVISEFDPWRSRLCTCPRKLTLNPYTGCDHACVYCYASAYVPRFSEVRPKKDVVSRVRREASTLKGETVSIANSSDPYPLLEADLCLTRNCLKILAQCNCRVQIVTKSSLVVRDADLLRGFPSMVSLTITTDDEGAARLIEPGSPSPSERLKAAAFLVNMGIPTSVRVDPIIPFLNDEPESLICSLASVGIKHVTSSTLKVTQRNWAGICEAVPEVAVKLRPFYFERGERIGGHFYLPRDLRLRLLKKVGSLAEKYGMKFGTCRDAVSFLNSGVCDGSWLLRANAVNE